MNDTLCASTNTLITIQKFLSAFLERLSKARLSVESIDPNGKDVYSIRQLSTRIIQQWNSLFPNSLIQSFDDVSTNSLIAAKTREEVVLDRSTQQKQKLLIEVEVLRSRWQQCQIESNHLKEEIAQLTSDIHVASSAQQHLQQERHSLVSTLSSLQLQKQHEDTELRNLQETKLSILEELVTEQQMVTSLRTSIQALQQEKLTQTKELERMKDEQLLLTRELDVLHQEVPGEATVNHTNTMTATAHSSATLRCENPLPEEDSIVVPAIQIRSVARRNRRQRRKAKKMGVRREVKQNLFADDTFWFPLC